MNEIEIIFTEKKFNKQVRFLAQNPKHWEFYVDDYYRCIFEKKGNTYILKHVGGHKIVERF
ncbi:MAG: hypothetical protein ACE5KT_04135 [Methanosarcinales archaeon]